MKTKLKHFIIAVVVCYLTSAFLMWDFNVFKGFPTKIEDRAIAVFMFVFCVGYGNIRDLEK
jgi:hypothetical protein